MLASTLVSREVRTRAPREYLLYIGTYTTGTTGPSEGIYVYRMNSVTGELSHSNAIKSVNPSFLAIDRSKRFLYAVNEVNDYAGKSSGAVSAFRIDSSSGDLTFLNQQETLGADPCYLTLNRSATTLLVANYTGGSVAVLPVYSKGQLGPPTDLQQHQGSSVRPQQSGPHAHSIVLDRTQRYALAADLGIDKVLIYRFDPKFRKLTPARQPWIAFTPGTGPRHLTFHPDGRHVYVINELNSSLTAIRYNEVTGTLSLLEAVTTLPTDFHEPNYCADVHVAPSGRFLYGSNRGHDSIVSFEIDVRTGRLKYIEHVSTGGKWPRNFTIDPTGNFLLVANQRSDNVVCFRIDARTGRLTQIGEVPIPSPACLKFA